MLSLDTIRGAPNGSPPAATPVGGRPLRRFLIFAAAWHLVWAAALVPYGLAAIALGQGVDVARGWIDSLGTVIPWVAVLAIVLLPINLIAATLAFRLGSETIGRRFLIVALFALGWFDFGGLAAASGGGFVLEAAVWAGLAGLAYGAIVTRLVLGSSSTGW